MSERERWIVYPLLFLALGTSLRDRILQTVQADYVDAGLITCQSLIVGDLETWPPDQLPLVGTITSVGSDGRVAAQFGPLVECQELRVDDARGMPQVVLGSTDAGGLVSTLDRTGQIILALGHNQRYSGLLIGNANGEFRPWFAPIRQPARPAEAKAETDAAPEARAPEDVPEDEGQEKQGQED